MGWAILVAVVIFIAFLFQKKKKVGAQAHNSSLFLRDMWSKCPKSSFAFCDLVEVFMFTISEKYFFQNPGKVRTAEFKIMLDDMAHDYLPECSDRLLLLKSNISEEGFFNSSYQLTMGDEKAQEIITTIDNLTPNS
ncbi:MAG: hypothetical protein PWQ57_1342 [Desulfovibrionales bacterium]|nr:hypothetical protein [Desulfovibrionales bacterium]